MSQFTVTVQDFAFCPPHIQSELPCHLHFKLAPYTSQQQVSVLNAATQEVVATSGLLQAGDSFTATLTQPGEYAFASDIYPFMSGGVVATDSCSLSNSSGGGGGKLAAEVSVDCIKASTGAEPSPKPVNGAAAAAEAAGGSKASPKKDAPAGGHSRGSAHSAEDSDTSPVASSIAAAAGGAAPPPAHGIEVQQQQPALMDRCRRSSCGSDTWETLPQQPSEMAVLELVTTGAAGAPPAAATASAKTLGRTSSAAAREAASAAAGSRFAPCAELSRSGRWARRATAYDDELDAPFHQASTAQYDADSPSPLLQDKLLQQQEQQQQEQRPAGCAGVRFAKGLEGLVFSASSAGEQLPGSNGAGGSDCSSVLMGSHRSGENPLDSDDGGEQQQQQGGWQRTGYGRGDDDGNLSDSCADDSGAAEDPDSWYERLPSHSSEHSSASVSEDPDSAAAEALLTDSPSLHRARGHHMQQEQQQQLFGSGGGPRSREDEQDRMAAGEGMHPGAAAASRTLPPLRIGGRGRPAWEQTTDGSTRPAAAASAAPCSSLLCDSGGSESDDSSGACGGDDVRLRRVGGRSSGAGGGGLLAQGDDVGRTAVEQVEAAQQTSPISVASRYALPPGSGWFVNGERKTFSSTASSTAAAAAAAQGPNEDSSSGSRAAGVTAAAALKNSLGSLSSTSMLGPGTHKLSGSSTWGPTASGSSQDGGMTAVLNRVQQVQRLQVKLPGAVDEQQQQRSPDNSDDADTPPALAQRLAQKSAAAAAAAAAKRVAHSHSSSTASSISAGSGGSHAASTAVTAASAGASAKGQHGVSNKKKKKGGGAAAKAADAAAERAAAEARAAVEARRRDRDYVELAMLDRGSGSRGDSDGVSRWLVTGGRVGAGVLLGGRVCSVLVPVLTSS